MITVTTQEDIDKDVLNSIENIGKLSLPIFYSYDDLKNILEFKDNIYTIYIAKKIDKVVGFAITAVTDEGGIHIFGTDKAGKDLFSRTLNAIYISLAVGTLGVIISFVLSLIPRLNFPGNINLLISSVLKLGWLFILSCLLGSTTITAFPLSFSM